MNYRLDVLIPFDDATDDERKINAQVREFFKENTTGRARDCLVKSTQEGVLRCLQYVFENPDLTGVDLLTHAKLVKDAPETATVASWDKWR
jgi:hypothetical protein